MAADYHDDYGNPDGRQDDEGQGNQEANARGQPNSWRELQDLKAMYPTSAHLVADLYNDQEHKLKCVILCEAARPLHAAFIRDDTLQAESVDAQRRFALERAENAWLDT